MADVSQWTPKDIGGPMLMWSDITPEGMQETCRRHAGDMQEYALQIQEAQCRGTFRMQKGRITTI